jgi:hypothetical protein
MNMASAGVGASRRFAIRSKSITAQRSDSWDDGFDFPPTAHPFRELVTFSLFLSGVVALIVWGVSKLI